MAAWQDDLHALLNPRICQDIGVYMLLVVTSPRSPRFSLIFFIPTSVQSSFRNFWPAAL